MEKKLTKKDLFGMLAELLEVADVEETEKGLLSEFIAHEVSLIDKKAEKSKTYKRKKDADTLKDAVAQCLGSDEFRVTSDLVADLVTDYPEVTAAKVTARLTALVKEGVAVKEDVKVDKRTLKGYKLA